MAKVRLADVKQLEIFCQAVILKGGKTDSFFSFGSRFGSLDSFFLFTFLYRKSDDDDCADWLLQSRKKPFACSYARTPFFKRK